MISVDRKPELEVQPLPREPKLRQLFGVPLTLAGRLRQSLFSPPEFRGVNSILQNGNYRNGMSASPNIDGTTDISPYRINRDRIAPELTIYQISELGQRMNVALDTKAKNYQEASQIRTQHQTAAITAKTEFIESMTIHLKDSKDTRISFQTARGRNRSDSAIKKDARKIAVAAYKEIVADTKVHTRKKEQVNPTGVPAELVAKAREAALEFEAMKKYTRIRSRAENAQKQLEIWKNYLHNQLVTDRYFYEETRPFEDRIKVEIAQLRYYSPEQCKNERKAIRRRLLQKQQEAARIIPEAIRSNRLPYDPVIKGLISNLVDYTSTGRNLVRHNTVTVDQDQELIERFYSTTDPALRAFIAKRAKAIGYTALGGAAVAAALVIYQNGRTTDVINPSVDASDRNSSAAQEDPAPIVTANIKADIPTPVIVDDNGNAIPDLIAHNTLAALSDPDFAEVMRTGSFDFLGNESARNATQLNRSLDQSSNDNIVLAPGGGKTMAVLLNRAAQKADELEAEDVQNRGITAIVPAIIGSQGGVIDIVVSAHPTADRTAAIAPTAQPERKPVVVPSAVSNREIAAAKVATPSQNPVAQRLQAVLAGFKEALNAKCTPFDKMLDQVFGNQADQAKIIMRKESECQPGARSGKYEIKLRDGRKVWVEDSGLMQINDFSWRGDFEKKYGPWEPNIFDPRLNILEAYDIYRQGGFGQWTTY